MRASLNEAETKAGAAGGAHIVMIGILPTLMPEHLDHDWMSESTRYAALNDSIFTARGEDIPIDISGPEPLSWHTATIAPESACTSTQLHLQVAAETFAANWNAAQIVAGPQLALGANSPFFFGHQLWAETRIELFAQSTDTRPEELKTQGVRPRVWFGERWIDSVLDLFAENIRYFGSLLPEVSDEDPVAELAAGRTPQLSELRLHNWHRLPVEPPGVRRRRRAPASATGEPGVAGRADRHRHAGELGLLLRHAAQPVRSRRPAVGPHGFRCGRSQFPHRGAARHRRPAALARDR